MRVKSSVAKELRALRRTLCRKHRRGLGDADFCRPPDDQSGDGNEGDGATTGWSKPTGNQEYGDEEASIGDHLRGEQMSRSARERRP